MDTLHKRLPDLRMAPIAAHMSLGDQLIHDLSPRFPALFLLGLIAPDSVPSLAKITTHHMKHGALNYPFYDWRALLASCAQHHSEPMRHYLFGYSAHLILDDFWRREIVSAFDQNVKRTNTHDTDHRIYLAEMARLRAAIAPDAGACKRIAILLRHVQIPEALPGMRLDYLRSFVSVVERDLQVEDDTHPTLVDGDSAQRLIRHVADALYIAGIILAL